MLRFVVTFVAFFVAAGSAVAADDSLAPCATPRSAASTILGNLYAHPPDVPAALRCIEVPRGLSHKEMLARLELLQRTLDARGVVVKPKDIPDDKAHLDERTFQPVFVLTPSLPLLRLERDARGEWMLPADVLEHAEDIYDGASIVDVETQAKKLGPAWQKKALGQSLWQWTGLLFILALPVLLRFVVTTLLLRRAAIAFKALGLHSDPRELRAASRPVGWLIGCGLVILLVPTLAMKASLTAFVTGSGRFFAAASVVWLCFGAVDVVAHHLAHRANATHSRMDDHLVPLLRRITKLIILMLGLVAALQFAGIDVGSLVAGLGIGGLAVALAAKDTIGNFFGSIAIFLDRPFQIGDWVVMNNGATEGAVENIGFRSTQIRTIRDTVITVPNAKLADSEIDNWGARRHRRLRFIISFGYESTAAQLEQFVLDLRQALGARKNVRAAGLDVQLHDIVDGIVQVLAHFYVDEADWSAELRARHEVVADIMNIAANLGLKLHARTVQISPTAPVTTETTNPTTATNSTSEPPSTSTPKPAAR